MLLVPCEDFLNLFHVLEQLIKLLPLLLGLTLLAGEQVFQGLQFHFHFNSHCVRQRNCCHVTSVSSFSSPVFQRFPISFQQLRKPVFGLFTACKGQVLVAESLCSLLSLAAQAAIEMKQDLALGHSSDSCSVAVSGADKGCVDVSPACWLATALDAAIR